MFPTLQLLGYVPWDQVSCEQNSPSIPGFLVYEDTRAAMMHREHPSFDRQAAVDYRLVFFNLNLVFREEETMHHVE